MQCFSPKAEDSEKWVLYPKAIAKVYRWQTRRMSFVYVFSMFLCAVVVVPLSVPFRVQFTYIRFVHIAGTAL